MNTTRTNLARTAVSSLAVAAIAMTTLPLAGASPGDPALPVVVASQSIVVSCNGLTCDPQYFDFDVTAPYNAVTVELTDILPGDCGQQPQWSATVDGLNLSPLEPGGMVRGPHSLDQAMNAGPHKLVINSKCPDAGRLLVQARWTGAVIVSQFEIVAGGAASTVTAVQDSTVYDKPNGKPYKDGNGADVFLAANQSLQMQAPERCSAVKDWCRVADPAAGPEAWIYAGQDKQGKPFVKIS